MTKITTVFIRKSVHKAISLIVAGIFLCTSMGLGPVVPKAQAASALVEVNQVLPAQFNVNTFFLPRKYGEIEDVFDNSSISIFPKTIIHIQDAHCNYAAQHKIKEIIEYLHKKYDIRTVNLEGGKGDYDLCLFTRIEDKDIRRQVCNVFVKEGLLNGAEYFDAMYPGKVQLHGIEDQALYRENLNVYRTVIKDRTKIDGHIFNLESSLSEIKKSVYSDDMMNMDAQYSVYRSEGKGMKEYLTCLIAQAARNNIAIGPEIKKMKTLYEMGKDINFKKAGNEREESLSLLKEVLSINEKKELFQKTYKFSEGEISEKEYYTYLINKTISINGGQDVVRGLKGYSEYVRIVEDIDLGILMEDIDRLEKRIKVGVMPDEVQRQTYDLSRNMLLIKDIFNISISSKDFSYYENNRERFSTRTFLDLIDKGAAKYEISSGSNSGIEALDMYREKMTDFYRLSFKRDKAFLDNMMFSKDEDNSGVTILVTGGFHQKNIADLCKEKNISYISLMPSFEFDPEQKCSYYDLLEGKESSLIKKIRTSVSTIAIESIFSELGLTNDMKDMSSFLSGALETLTRGEDVDLPTDDGHIVFSMTRRDIKGGKTSRITLKGRDIFVTVVKNVLINMEEREGDDAAAVKKDRGMTVRIFRRGVKNIKRMFAYGMLDAYLKKGRSTGAGELEHVDIVKDQDLRSEIVSIQEEMLKSDYDWTKGFRKISKRRIPRIFRSLELKGLYKRDSGKYPVEIIEKHVMHFANMKRFIDDNNGDFLVENDIGGGICPVFYSKDVSPGICEFNLRPFGYIPLSEAMHSGRIVCDDELRGRIRDIIERYFHPEKGDHWFKHNHLHMDNIVLKVSSEGHVDDIRIIDFTMMKMIRKSELDPDLKRYMKGEKDIFAGQMLSTNLPLDGLNFDGGNFSGADFTLVKVNWVSFRNADLSGAKFEHFFDIGLCGVDFSYADLTGAKFSETLLAGVSFKGADLTDADLRGTRLDNVDMKGANLTGADLRNFSTSAFDPRDVILKDTIFNKSLSSYFEENNCKVVLKEDHCLVSNIDDSGEISVFSKKTDNCILETTVIDIKKDILDKFKNIAEYIAIKRHYYRYPDKTYDEFKSMLEEKLLDPDGKNIVETRRDKIGIVNLWEEAGLTEDLLAVKKIIGGKGTGSKLKKINDDKVPELIGRGSKFRGYYRYEGSNGERNIIEKESMNIPVIKEFLMVPNSDVCPSFVVEGIENRFFELDISSMGYLDLRHFAENDGNKITPEIRRIIREKAALAFRRGKDIFFHGYLHFGNILVKPGEDGEIEDIKFIDWGLLEKRVLPEKMKEVLSGKRKYLGKEDLSGVKVDGVDFKGVRFEGTIFKKSVLEWSDFRNTRLDGVKFDVSRLTGSDFSGAEARETSFLKTFLGGVSFRDADISGSDIKFSVMHMTDFRRTDMKGVNAVFTEIVDADMSGADLEGADLSWSYLENVDFRSLSDKKTQLDPPSFRGSFMKKVLFDREHGEAFKNKGYNVEYKEGYCEISSREKNGASWRLFGSKIREDIRDENGNSFYSDRPQIKGEVVEKIMKETHLHMHEVLSDNIVQNNRGEMFYLLKDKNMFGEKPVLVQKELMDIMKKILGWESESDFMAFLSAAMAMRYKERVQDQYDKLKRSSLPAFVFCQFESSPFLFGNHTKDGIIGVNRILFEKISENKNSYTLQNILRTILMTGFTHELGHEAGNDDEFDLNEKDIDLTVQLCGEMNIRMREIISALLPFIEESLFINGLIREYFIRNSFMTPGVRGQCNKFQTYLSNSLEISGLDTPKFETERLKMKDYAYRLFHLREDAKIDIDLNEYLYPILAETIREKGDIVDIQFAVAGEAVEDVRGGTKNIIIMPCSPIYESVQCAAVSSIDDEYPEKDLKVLYYKFGMEPDRREALYDKTEKGLNEIYAALKNGDRSARQLIYIDVEDILYFKKSVEKISGNIVGRDREVSKNVLMERVTVIPIQNMPYNGVLDDINHIIAGLGLLNAKRYLSGEYEGAELGPEAVHRLNAYLDTVFENIYLLGNTPEEIIRKILDGVIMRVKRMDFSDIQRYKDRQRAFLRSL